MREETAGPLAEQGQRLPSVNGFLGLSQLCRPHRAVKDWKGSLLFLPPGWSLIIFSVVASPNGSVLTFSDSLHLGRVLISLVLLRVYLVRHNVIFYTKILCNDKNSI